MEIIFPFIVQFSDSLFTKIQGAFLASIFVFRLKSLRIKRGLMVHTQIGATTQLPDPEAPAANKLEEMTEMTPQRTNIGEGCEGVVTAARKRGRPPATPQEGGVLLELLRKRRFCK